jgi:NAD(P)-dependent dehydrogenase (short-subunit alcohol dehydrogenase family)
MSTGQTILITGANSGFGRLTAITLARQGQTVYASMRESTGKNAGAAAELADLAARSNLNLSVIDLDVTADNSVEQAVQHILDVSGQIDGVVNNAGIFMQGPLEGYTEDQVYQQFDANVFGVLRINRAVLPSMRARRSGLLIQVGSIVGRVALPGIGLYSASKFALEGLTEAYHHELADAGIEAVIVEPGTYPTPLGSKALIAGDQSRLAPYGALLTQVGTALQTAVSGRDTAAPDSQEVADAIASLIAMPAGSRPLRTVVAISGQREGATALNQASEQAIHAIFQGLGLSPLTASR